MVLYKSAISLFFDSLHQLFIGEHALQCQPQSLIGKKSAQKSGSYSGSNKKSTPDNDGDILAAATR